METVWRKSPRTRVLLSPGRAVTLANTTTTTTITGGSTPSSPICSPDREYDSGYETEASGLSSGGSRHRRRSDPSAFSPRFGLPLQISPVVPLLAIEHLQRSDRELQHQTKIAYGKQMQELERQLAVYKNLCLENGISLPEGKPTSTSGPPSPSDGLKSKAYHNDRSHSDSSLHCIPLPSNLASVEIEFCARISSLRTEGQIYSAFVEGQFPFSLLPSPFSALYFAPVCPLISLLSSNLLGWLCAIKEVYYDVEEADSWESVFSTLSSLPKHPNIADYLYFQMLSDRVRLFMRLYSSSLKNYIDRHKESSLSIEPQPKYFSVRQIALCLLDIASGLSVLHENGIIHRGLLPFSCFLTPLAFISSFVSLYIFRSKE